MAGLVMMIISWWTYEVGVFLSGLLGEVQLGAMSITFQLQVLFCMFPAGVSVAASIRVGHNLGAGNADGAKTSHWTAQTFSWMIYLLAGTLVLSVRNFLPLMFSHDSDVIELTSITIVALAAVMFIDSITIVIAGTFGGCGQQYLGAVCNFVGYILITIPLAAVLMFPAKMGAVGFWMGLAIGTAPVAVFYLIIMLYTDWGSQVEKAQKRISVPGDSCEALDIKTGGSDVKEAIPSPDMWMPPMSSSYKRRLLICRLITVLLSLAVLGGGVFVRIFVPLPPNAFSNETVPLHLGSHMNKTPRSFSSPVRSKDRSNRRSHYNKGSGANRLIAFEFIVSYKKPIFHPTNYDRLFLHEMVIL
ncbi:multidrug and toxin extrusion protein 2-like [Liolophura sinensis]|uniref:multidrug and toxin extrusion protein 2-like n=1 Tax=Liolophura sinensis TaxID=3198878 RepID=UPI00315950DB